MHARPIFQIHWKLSSRMQPVVQIIQLLFVSIAEVMTIFIDMYRLLMCLNMIITIASVLSLLFSGLIPEAGAGRAMLLCDSCVLPKESRPSQTQITDVTQR